MDSIPSAMAAQSVGIQTNLASYSVAYSREAVATANHQGAAAGKPAVQQSVAQAGDKEGLRDQPRRYQNPNLGQNVNIVA